MLDDGPTPVLPASATSAATGRLPPIDKVIVAVHGIGSQRRCDTIRSVAAQFGLPLGLPQLPLGYFSVDGIAEVKVTRLDVQGGPLQRVGFAEVYWADIPRAVVAAGDSLDETKAWGRTVVSHAQAAYEVRMREQAQRALGPVDFERAGDVVDEIVDAVQVLENLSAVTDKMGVFKFDVAPLLRDYVDDVQVFTEFPAYRERILARFHKTMADIAGRFARQENGGRAPELYIVAHSEGTVVSFVALLQAMAQPAFTDPEPGGDDDLVATDWLQQVRGFMTLGSPIDKHLVLWDRLWRDFAGRIGSTVQGGEVVFPATDRRGELRLPQPIAWRNYYDIGDPVGFMLDTARHWLAAEGCAAFDFTPEHDIGFSRYPLPGAAHVGYWKDREVFAHFIAEVVRLDDDAPAPAPAAARDAARAAPRIAPPANKRWASVVGYVTPYLLVAALHLVAVFVLFRGLHGFFEADMTAGDITRNVVPFSLLMVAVTFAGRVPRLLRVGRWRWLALSIAALVAASLLVLDQSTIENRPLVWGSVAGAWAVVAAGWLMPASFRSGRRLLIVTGSAVVLAMVAVQMTIEILHSDKQHGLWPMLLAAAAFVYLWWLGVMVFDLAFIWHRYIRHAVAHDALAAWQAREDLQPRAWFGRTREAAPPAAAPALPGRPAPKS